MIKKYLLNKKTALTLAITAFIVAVSINMVARPDGISGKTGPTSGCTCHGSNPTTSTTVSVTSGSGSFSVAPGGSLSLTVTVSNSAQQAAGFNAAVKTTETGETNAGTLTAGTGSKILDGEITHSSPLDMSGGSASFTFSWTAPSTPGTYYLRAAGNAVNDNGNNSGDLWNRMTVQQIVVKGLDLAAPNGGESWCAGSNNNITWTASGVSNIKIEYSSNGGSNWNLVAENVNASTGSYAWNIPSNLSGNNIKIRLSDQSDANINDVSAAAFTVSSGAQITAQPQSVSACSGTNVTLSVTVTGGVSSYQWKKNGTNINGATQATYTMNNVTDNNEGSYEVTVTPTCGTAVTSNAATVTVRNVPAITTQPLSGVICLGQAVNIVVVATGDSLSYQWKKDGVNINGATAPTYSFTATSNDEGIYTVQVSGACNTVITSNPANISVAQPHAISKSPQSADVCEGSDYILTVNTVGSDNTFQWRKNGANINGATESSYTLNDATADAAGEYDVVVSGPCGSPIMSNKAVITINQATAITVQPVAKQAQSGENVTLSVTASGKNLTYQWYKNAQPVQGATSATLNFASIQQTDAGNYYVVVKGLCGQVTSSTVAVQVSPAGAGAFISLSTAAIMFDTTDANVSLTKILTVKNTGDQPLTINQFRLDGPGAAAYSVTLVNPPVTIAAGDSLNLTLLFNPTTQGAHTANLSFSGNAVNAPVVTLAGFAWRTDADIDISGFAFETGAVGQLKTDTILVVNNSSNTVFVTGVSLTGSNVFTVDQAQLPMQVAPNSTGRIVVRFLPTAAGNFEGVLTVFMEGHRPVEVTLNGSAITSVLDDILALEPAVYPNPSAHSVRVVFSLKKAASISAAVYDINGRVVKSFSSSEFGLGENTIVWDGRSDNGSAAPAGVYSFTIESGGEILTLPLSIVK